MYKYPNMKAKSMKNMMRVLIAFITYSLLHLQALAASEYAVRPGDILTVFIPGINLERKLEVNVDGRISLPLVGDLYVNGGTIAGIQKMVGDIISKKTYTQRLQDGREIPTVISPSEVSVDISQYRPIYILGDVLNPGDKMFRPGVNVRQLVSMAGGYSLTQMRFENPYLGFADLRSQYDEAWADYLKYKTRIDWLRKSLNLGRSEEVKTAQKNPLGEAETSRISQSEVSYLVARSERNERERTSLQAVAREEANRIAALEKQRLVESQSLEFDTAEEKRINDLVKNGSAAANRATDVRRLGLLSATRELQVGALVEAEKRNQKDTLKKMQTIDDEYITTLRMDLRDAVVDLAKVVSRRESIWEKMLYLGAIKMKIFSDLSNQVEFQISRHDGAKRVNIKADADTELEPGDVVQVSIDISNIQRVQ